jgi:hypothetical protein
LAGSGSGDPVVCVPTPPRHEPPSALRIPVSVLEYCIHPRSLARHDSSRSFPLNFSFLLPSRIIKSLSLYVSIYIVYIVCPSFLMPYPSSFSFDYLSKYIVSYCNGWMGEFVIL